jgi:hypothetical protein
MWLLLTQDGADVESIILETTGELIELTVGGVQVADILNVSLSIRVHQVIPAVIDELCQVKSKYLILVNGGLFI